MGIKGSPTTELYFEDCRIPGDRIIGEPGTGFKTALATLDHTRPTIGAQAVGIAQGALDAAIAYVKERKQFGKRISDFQAVQFMLADMAMKIEAARLMVYTAAARAERGEPNLGFISSASKCFASDVAMEVTTDAVQLFGGYGYTADFPVERFMRDAKITQIYEGTNQIQRVVMARALLGRIGLLAGSVTSGAGDSVGSRAPRYVPTRRTRRRSAGGALFTRMLSCACPFLPSGTATTGTESLTVMIASTRSPAGHGFARPAPPDGTRPSAMTALPRTDRLTEPEPDMRSRDACT